MRELSLYLHIPFCVRKCAYCDFLSWEEGESGRERYVGALLEEISSYKGWADNFRVSTVFLGGGTPSVLSGLQIERILDRLNCIFRVEEDAEISVEANPGTVDFEKLMSFRRAGINRISFGLQSAHAEELAMLGRIHTYDEFLDGYHLARKAGFTNVNVDLISAIPKQTVLSWEENLKRVLELEPEHVSAYSLIVEEGTPFFERDRRGELELPCEEAERLMYEKTYEILQLYGYQQYEISNYAKEGRECRHNICYWKRKNYLGLGLGSASLMDNVRFSNTEDMGIYLKDSAQHDVIRMNRDELDVIAQMEEFMFLGLRMMEGVSETEFAQAFSREMRQVYAAQLDKIMEDGLMEYVCGRYRLTRKGIDVSNYVFEQFLI